ncbi:SDR family oxidoreductase [Sphingomonas sp. KR1UV-12]|uniref:SDR family oxidoreductase n=1 Tax=Sphingomonas aurea TaxID=3063994 RepID=A0ABT9EKX9_9SPHN|nr:SDR family oxidoreductase [Sphingomonas sp. KR1UV-12]MDP1027611.1 SDR family oxidoreductase [Sphingomonas sp. KR1UV-12]
MAARSLLVLGKADGVAAAIGAVLCAGDYSPVAEGQIADAILIDGVDEAPDTPFLDLTEEAFVAQAIDATLDRRAALLTALECAAADAAILVIASDAYLGRWHGAGQAAGSAALIGMMRSVAMEHGRSGLRVNALALPSGVDPEAAAVLAAALIESPAAHGQCVLADGGDNLKLRQARRR